MPAVAIALIWASYSYGLWGYCLIKGYNVGLRQLFSTTWPPTGTGGSAPGDSGSGGKNIAPGPNIPKPGFGGI